VRADLRRAALADPRSLEEVYNAIGDELLNQVMDSARSTWRNIGVGQPKRGNLLAFALLMLLSHAPVSAEASQAPAGCHWQDIQEIKVQLAVPDGWVFRQVPSEQKLIYEVLPAGPAFAKPPQARYRLEVRRHLEPRDVVAMARSFVETVRTGATAAEPLEQQTKGVMALFASVVEYAPEISGAPRLTVAVSAIANSRTGTLYTARFDIPVDEQSLVAPLGNALFQSVRLDDEV
jgi:hypothetical protein